jgi:nucleotide-binding universal stress UspA family protein
VIDGAFIKTILAAVDSSDRAPSVFDAAAALAAKFGAKLHVIRVISIPPEFPAAAAASHADSLPAHLEEVAIAQMSELILRAPDLSIAAPIVAIGQQPWRLILTNAQRLGADLIVLGSHGYGGWDRVLGTTAGKVANLADRNVFVVHTPSG